MCDAPTPPPAPAPIDPAESGLDYLRGMVQLQPQLLAAEQQYRPQFNQLNLQDMGRTLLGSGYDEYAQSLQGPTMMTAPIQETAPGASGIPTEGSQVNPSSYTTGDNLDETLQGTGMYDPMFAGFGPTDVDPGYASMNAGQGALPGATGDPNQKQFNVASQTIEPAPYTPGALDLADVASRRLQDLNEDIASQQRESDIEDVERLGSRASEAFLDANPRLKAALDEAEGMTGETDRAEFDRLEELLMGEQSEVTQTLGDRALGLAQSQGALTPFERMALEEQARSASTARGRELDNSSIADELGTRIAAQRDRKMQDLAMAANLNNQQLAAKQQKVSGLGALAGLKQGQQAQDRQYQLNYAGMLGSTASDPFMAILGRPSQSVSQGQGQLGASQSLIGQSTPQLFNPDAGINLALQNQSNLANYNSNIYGAQAGYKGSVIGGGLSALGSTLGSIFGG